MHDLKKGALLALLYQQEARYTYSTGDRGRKCRGPQAIEARQMIDAILREMESVDA